jgi:hypothetical protein
MGSWPCSLPTGASEIYATGLSAAAFAFDVEGNLYATTHPFDHLRRQAKPSTTPSPSRNSGRMVSETRW